MSPPTLAGKGRAQPVLPMKSARSDLYAVPSRIVLLRVMRVALTSGKSWTVSFYQRPDAPNQRKERGDVTVWKARLGRPAWSTDKAWYRVRRIFWVRICDVSRRQWSGEGEQYAI